VAETRFCDTLGTGKMVADSNRISCSSVFQLFLCCRKDSCMKHLKSRKSDVTSMQLQMLKTEVLDDVHRTSIFC